MLREPVVYVFDVRLSNGELIENLSIRSDNITEEQLVAKCKKFLKSGVTGGTAFFKWYRVFMKERVYVSIRPFSFELKKPKPANKEVKQKKRAPVKRRKKSSENNLLGL